MNATITTNGWPSLLKKLNSDVKLAGFLFMLIVSCGCDEGAPSGKKPEAPIQRSSGAVQSLAQVLKTGSSKNEQGRNPSTDYVLHTDMTQKEYDAVANALIGKATDWESSVLKAIEEKKVHERALASEQSNYNSALSQNNNHNAFKPLISDKAKKLTVGEFESDDEFKKRQAETMANDEKENKEALEAWVKKKDALAKDYQKAREVLEKQKPGLELKINEAQARILSNYWITTPLPTLSRTYQAKEVPLPVFDRVSMSFAPLVLPSSQTIEFKGTGTILKVATILENESTSFQVKFKTLADAKRFKDQYDAGQYKCRVSRCLDIRSIESPIIVQREVTKEQETYMTKGNAGRLLGALVVGAIGGAMGATPQEMANLGDAMNSDPNLQIRPDKKTIVVQPEIKADGTRYYFTMTPYAISFVDNNGSVVDALVEFKTNHVVIKDVLKNSSLASSGVVPGDKIIRVGNSTVRNITSLRSALRAYPLGEKIEVFFRNSKSGTEFKIVTNGGESLGLVIE